MHALSYATSTNIPTGTLILLPSQMEWSEKGHKCWLRWHFDHAAILAILLGKLSIPTNLSPPTSNSSSYKIKPSTCHLEQ
eukprot:1139299-Pelagomonas_calceolata.AAC.2